MVPHDLFEAFGSFQPRPGRLRAAVGVSLAPLWPPAGGPFGPVVVVKPLVHFEENIISTEAVQGPFDVVIAEGTYTALLAQPSVKAFINRDFRKTKKDRLARNRDQALENGQDQALTFLEEVLTIEHEEIKQHKELASLVIPAPHDI